MRWAAWGGSARGQDGNAGRVVSFDLFRGAPRR